MSLTSDLADFSSGTTFNDIPDPIVDTTKLLFLDTLICGLAGQDFERTRMMHSVVNQLGGPEESTVFGLTHRVPATNAAMANAEIMNLLDADDTFFSSSHFAAFNVAATLAMGERLGCSGKDVILATLVGFDVNARLNLSAKVLDVIDGEFKWSQISGLGFAAIGTAVSAGIILGLTQNQMRNLFGISGWFAPGPASGRMSQTSEWSTMKYSPYGAITQAGMLAAMFAKAGYLGDNNMLDGEDGFWKIQGSVSTDQGLLVEDLGRKWWIDETAIKFYPSCRYTHAPIDMLKKLMSENDLNADDIEHIEVKLNPMAYAIPIFNNPKLKIDGHSHCAPFNGQFNIPYIMALTALGRRPGPGWHKPESFEDPEVIT
jgi:2-methylcitrate dehydratase PrpD